MSDDRSIRVLIFDPSPIYAQGPTLCLEGSADLFCVGTATTEREARTAIAREGVSVVIIAGVMPQVDVTKFIRDIRLERPRIQVLALGDPWLDPFPTGLIRAGVGGYLMKDCDADELTLAIRAVSQGKIYFASPVASVLVDQIHRVGESNGDGSGARLDLTKREAEVLELVAAGTSNRDIAVALQVSARTAENHVQRVYRKLGVHDRTNAVILGIRDGYLPRLSSELWSERGTREIRVTLAEQSHQGAEAVG